MQLTINFIHCELRKLWSIPRPSVLGIAVLDAPHLRDTGPMVSIAPLLIPDKIPSVSLQIGEVGGKRQLKADWGISRQMPEAVKGQKRQPAICHLCDLPCPTEPQRRQKSVFLAIAKPNISLVHHPCSRGSLPSPQPVE